MDFMIGILIACIPAALAIVLFGIDNYLQDHPGFIKGFIERRQGRH